MARVYRRLLTNFNNMANLRNKKQSATVMSCRTIEKFKKYLKGDHPLGTFTRFNRELLEERVSHLNVYFLFCLICNAMRAQEDVLECITIDLSHKYFDDAFPNRGRYYSLRNELEQFMVITKVNKDNHNCTLYYLNPSFYNVLSLSQRMLFRDSYSHLFAGFGD